jgi:hypothetical protein
VLELRELEETKLETWFLTWRWLADPSPFEIRVRDEATENGSALLDLKLRDGIREATIEVDRESWLPRSLRYVTAAGAVTWTLTDYNEALGFRFPHRLLREVVGIRRGYRVQSIREAPLFVRSPFEYLPAEPGDTIFDPEASAELEVRRNNHRHLMVRPWVDGEQVGWFILDSGAGRSVITPGAADRLGLESFGETAVTGAGGSVPAVFRQAGSFRLGPLTISDPVLLELDLGFLPGDVAGIVGYDVYRRSVVELDLKRAAVRLFDPRSYRRQDHDWEELFLTGKVPSVRCRFAGDRDGICRLDTGDPGTVVFHTSTVRELALVEGRETRPARLGGVGGRGRAREGAIEWFEIGGHRFREPSVLFALAEKGAFANPYITGNVGLRMLRHFELVLDYPRRRIAFLRSAESRTE